MIKSYFGKTFPTQWCMGRPKVNTVKHFLLFLSLWNVYKPNFTLMPWASQKLLGENESKFFVKSKLYYSRAFVFINILLKLQQQIVMCSFASLFALLIYNECCFSHYWTIEYYL